MRLPNLPGKRWQFAAWKPVKGFVLFFLDLLALVPAHPDHLLLPIQTSEAEAQPLLPFMIFGCLQDYPSIAGYHEKFLASGFVLL